jgi:nucleotide-binding universal stress UspA family protein
MASLHNGVRAESSAPASETDARTPSEFKRVLVAVADASQVDSAAALARQAGASKARVLHLNLRESIGGRRFPLETESAAVGVAEAAVLELRLAGIEASGQVMNALLDRAAEAIIDQASDWEADLVVLGSGHRGEIATRLFGSATLRVLKHAPCPVLVAPSPRKRRVRRAA